MSNTRTVEVFNGYCWERRSSLLDVEFGDIFRIMKDDNELAVSENDTSMFKAEKDAYVGGNNMTIVQCYGF